MLSDGSCATTGKRDVYDWTHDCGIWHGLSLKRIGFNPVRTHDFHPSYRVRTFAYGLVNIPLVGYRAVLPGLNFAMISAKPWSVSK